MKYQITWEEKCRITYFLAELGGALDALSKVTLLGSRTQETLERLRTEADEIRASLHRLEGYILTNSTSTKASSL